MTDDIDQLAARLASEVEKVLGAGFVLDDLALESNGRVHARAIVLAEGHIETVEVEADSIEDVRAELIRRAADLRLAGAWTRMITLT